MSVRHFLRRPPSVTAAEAGAANLLVENGFEAVNMSGGLIQWRRREARSHNTFDRSVTG